MTRFVLVAHGSPREAWYAPFVELHAAFLAKGLDAELCYLEHRKPTLVELLAAAAAARVDVVVWPLFLAGGGHVTRDVAEVVERARVEHGLRAEVYSPLLEDADLRRFIVDKARNAIANAATLPGADEA